MMTKNELIAQIQALYNPAIERQSTSKGMRYLVRHPETDKIVVVVATITDENGQIEPVMDLYLSHEPDLSKMFLGRPFLIERTGWHGIRISPTPERYLNSYLKAALEPADSSAENTVQPYTETKIHFNRPRPARQEQEIPEKIQQMYEMFDASDRTRQAESVNFVRQARFMEDYEDDFVFDEPFYLYYPRYQRMRVDELRGYFSWRTKIRKGIYLPAFTGFIKLYCFELLNLVGAKSPTDAIEKMEALRINLDFETCDASSMREQIRDYQRDLAILSDLGAQEIRKWMQPEELAWDESLLILKNPDAHTDEEIYNAILKTDAQLSRSLLVKANDSRVPALYSALWKKVLQAYQKKGRNFFRLCFGTRKNEIFYALAGVPYLYPENFKPAKIEISELRSYTYDQRWMQSAYSKQNYRPDRFASLFTEADRQIREYLGIGRRLKPRPANHWAVGFVQEVIQEDRARVIEASRPKVEIRFDSLDEIRKNAAITRESLLTEEEKQGDGVIETPVPKMAETQEEETQTVSEMPSMPAAGLTEFQTTLLHMLLKGESVQSLLADNGQMPEIAADEINEALYDEIGDTAVECDQGEIALVEDYADEIRELLGG